jgi:hypothetical protein
MGRSVYLLLFIFASCIVLIVGCAKNSYEKIGAIEPPETIADSFEELYPDAADATWRVENGYYVITFKNQGLQNKAWLNFKGKYVMLVSSIPAKEIPIAIDSAIKKSEYSGGLIMEIDTITQTGMGTRFVVKLDRDNAYYNLFYTKFGGLIKTENVSKEQLSGLNPTPVPEVLTEYVCEYYPDSQIMNFTQSGHIYEVSLLEGETLKTVRLSLTNQ